MVPETYEVFALKYATVSRRSSENFIGGDPHDHATTMDYFVWLIRSPGRTILVDTGFNEDAARRRKREFLRCPIESLGLLGVDRQEIQDVVLTHLHYDHAGNCDLLPKARFYLQHRELQYATGASMRHALLRAAYQVEDVLGIVRAVYEERVTCVNGERELAPGITLHRVGGHTAGLQIVRVRTRKGWMVLASDATHFYANYQNQNPFPIVHHVGEMLDAYETLNELADNAELIVPGHDPLVMENFDAPSQDLKGIVAQLA